jgi:hypothetical protein
MLACWWFGKGRTNEVRRYIIEQINSGNKAEKIGKPQEVGFSH